MPSNYSEQDKKYLKKFGARVRALRQKAGYSQESFALEIGLDRTYVGSVERGERNLALLNIRKIARGLHMTEKELFGF